MIYYIAREAEHRMQKTKNPKQRFEEIPRTIGMRVVMGNNRLRRIEAERESLDFCPLFGGRNYEISSDMSLSVSMDRVIHTFTYSAPIYLAPLMCHCLAKCYKHHSEPKKSFVFM